MSDYLANHFPDLAASFPDTAEKRRAGMAAFRAKLLATHERILATIEATGLFPDGKKPTKRDIQFQRDTIASIKAAQRKYGEA